MLIKQITMPSKLKRQHSKLQRQGTDYGWEETIRVSKKKYKSLPKQFRNPLGHQNSQRISISLVISCTICKFLRKARFKHHFYRKHMSDTCGEHPPSAVRTDLRTSYFLKQSADLRLIFGAWPSFDLNPIGRMRACYVWWRRFHCSMAASFYASPLIGATTTLACFAHEIPHEIADYSILIRSGFTKRQAMQSQFLTATGAFVSWFSPLSIKYSWTSLLLMHFSMIHVLGWVRTCCFWKLCSWTYTTSVSDSFPALPSVLFGLSACCSTFIGIAVHNITKTNSGSSSSIDLAAGIRQDASGLLGTTALLSDLVCLPFVKSYCCFCPLPIV